MTRTCPHPRERRTHAHWQQDARTGWSHIRRADRALEGKQGTLTTQRPGGSRESTTSFAANKCTPSPRPRQPGWGAGICKKPALLRTERAQARQGLPRRQADLVCRTLTHKMGDTCARAESTSAPQGHLSQMHQRCFVRKITD